MNHPATRTLSIILLALLAFASLASAADVEFATDKGTFVQGVRCATHTPTFEETQRVQAAVDAWLRDGGRVTDKALVNIPVAVHIVAEDDGYGDISDDAVAAQMDVLNDAYASAGFSFTLASLDRTYNTRWSTHRYASVNERRMKEALAIDPATTFNLYFCNIGGGLLGYATFPYMYPEDSYMHGVVCLWASVPGGPAVPYDEGDTATHETGHFLGLYHTFQDGCTEPNDYCDDTPAEGEPAFGCPEGRDTCVGDDVDPIHNFMDYVDDYCMDHFTNDQWARMHEQMALYRPTMYGGGGSVTLPTAAFSGSPTSGDYPLTVQFTDQSTGSPTSWSWTFGDGGTSTSQSPSHLYAAAGSYTVSLTVANADGSDTLTRSGYITVTEPGTGGGTMHVADMNVYRTPSGRKYYGNCDVTIVDDAGAPVSGATVSVTYTGTNSGSLSGLTGTDGVASFLTVKSWASEDFCFTVTDVAHASYDYDAAANAVTQSCEGGDVYRSAGEAITLGNQPNPFNPMTVIEFSMPYEAKVSLRIYDVHGRLVDTLVDRVVGAGAQSVTWDARDQASGMYFYQLVAGDETVTRKMVLLK